MMKFPGLDGLRGWLAWVVVLDHIAFFTGLGAPWISRDEAQLAGAVAVMIFIILSGFVITHLVIEKAEPYGLYLARRALRIYPVYLVALFMGIGATFLTFKTFLTPDGALDPAAMSIIQYPETGVLMFDRAAAYSSAYFAHLALHLTMLHGAISQAFLPHSQLMFLSPAWSLSLEWQFYLVAPFIVRAAAHKLGSIGVGLAGAGALRSLQPECLRPMGHAQLPAGRVPLFRGRDRIAPADHGQALPIFGMGRGQPGHPRVRLHRHRRLAVARRDLARVPGGVALPAAWRRAQRGRWTRVQGALRIAAGHASGRGVLFDLPGACPAAAGRDVLRRPGLRAHAGGGDPVLRRDHAGVDLGPVTADLAATSNCPSSRAASGCAARTRRSTPLPCSRPEQPVDEAARGRPPRNSTLRTSIPRTAAT